MSEPADIYAVQSDSPRATLALGESLGRCLEGQLVIGLVGQLGAGKTLLVKGIASGDATEKSGEVTSPTFTLVNEYPGVIGLCHLDAYRLKDSKELIAIGFDELARGDRAVVVEWADRVRDVMPDDCLWVNLEVTGPSSRTLSMKATGPVATGCLKRLQATCG